MTKAAAFLAKLITPFEAAVPMGIFLLALACVHRAMGGEYVFTDILACILALLASISNLEPLRYSKAPPE